MATREELIRGIEMLIQEGRRIGGAFSSDDWSKAKDFDGWKNTEVLAHVAAIGSLVAPMVTGMANAPAGTDAGATVNIDQLNATLVAARADKTAAELVEELEKNYAGVIDFVKNAPDDLLARKATFGGYVDVEVSELLVRMVILHGLAHIYSAYSAVMGL